MSAYKYRPLTGSHDIRILELHAPGQDLRLSVSGTLHHYTLETAPPFVALSYAWGDLETMRRLETPEGLIRITSSLAGALKRFSKSLDNDATFMIWADAACINQEDDGEKGHQVGLMSKIYSMASCVYVWLGEEADDSAMAFSLFEKLDALKELPEVKLFQAEEGNDVLPESIDVPGDDRSWNALWKLLQRPWYARAWVLQEFIVAADVVVYCGESSIHWVKMFPAFRMIHYLQRRVRVFEPYWGHKTVVTYSVILMRDLRTYYGMGLRYKLISLLEDHSQFRRASDPRDHLFAFLGLSFDSDNPQLAPDYRQPFEAIVRQYVAFFVEDSVMDLLYRASYTEGDKLLSWIPHWTFQDVYEFRGRFNLHMGAQALTGTPVEAAFNRELDLLSLKGYICETIHILKGNKKMLDQDNSISDDGILSLCSEIESLYIKKGIEDYPSSSRASVTGSQKRNLEAVQKLEAPDAIIKVLEREKWRFGSGILGLISWLAHRKSHKRGPGRLFDILISESGFLGLSSHKAVDGDLIFVPFGSKVPFLIRKSDYRPEHHRLVDQCYIHGMMNGELQDTDMFEVQQISLV